MQLLFNNKKKLAVIVLICSASAAGCRFYFQKSTDHFTALKTSRSLENGKNLAVNICAGCHYNESSKKYTGIPLNDLPKIAGKLYSANLTHSVAHGRIEQYSDAELFYLVKTGISKSGKFMPYMMRPTMADGDINDLILYFRSDDSPLAASDSTFGKTRINLIGRMGIRLASKPAPYVKNVARPDENNLVDYGRYLVGIIGCYHCHSKKVLGLNYLNPEKSKGYLQGGLKLKDFEGKRVFASNLTPDKSTGIGRLSPDDFSRAVKEGISPSGRKLSAPMPVFSDMTTRQASAIYAYLQQLPPVHHAVKSK